jgi:hypothetical protein
MDPQTTKDSSSPQPFPSVIEAPVSWGTHKAPADGFKALVNPDTGQVFSIVSKDYRLIRHEEAVSRLEEVIEKSPGLGRYEVERSFYNEGARIRQTYRFIDHTVEINSRDLVSPELHLFNSYDVTWPFKVLLGAFRFVCGNGLVVGKTFLHFKRRHVYELEDMGVDDEVETALKRFNTQAGQWRRWAGIRLSGKAYKEIIDGMKFGKKAMALIDDHIEAEFPDTESDKLPAMSLWQFYNVVTWYITHHTASLNHLVEFEKRLRVATTDF